MNKLENASGNLKEILMAIADGKAVEYFMESQCAWWTMKPSNAEFVFTHEAYGYKWRVKPDAFATAWGDFIGEYVTYHGSRHAFKSGWDAAMEHKDDD